MSDAERKTKPSMKPLSDRDSAAHHALDDAAPDALPAEHVVSWSPADDDETKDPSSAHEETSANEEKEKKSN